MIARLNLGGPAHQVAFLSGRRFDPDRYEVLLVHGAPGPGEESAAELAASEGARIELLPELGPEISGREDAASLAKLVRIVRSFRPDLIDTHTSKAGFLGRQAAILAHPARARRPKLVHTFHGHVLERYFGRAKSGLFRGIERQLARSTDALVSVSRATIDDMVRLGVAPPDKLHHIPIGLDLAGLREGIERSQGSFRAELGIGGDEVLATLISRIAPIKRLDVLLEAVAVAAREAPQLRVAVVGDGPERGELEAMAARLGLAEVVRFCGYRSDVPNILAGADLAVLSSDNEGTPVSLIEAGAAGLPVAATDAGGTREVVGAGGGILVPCGDHRALGEALARLAGEPELRQVMGEEARRMATERFGVDRLIDDYDRLYTDLLS